MKKKIIKQNATHKAVLSENGMFIDIFIKGFKCGAVSFEDEFLWSLSVNEKDDLFDLFERFEEDNRANIAEFVKSFEMCKN